MDKLSRRFVIGTVQFGLDYGINNARGKVPEGEVSAILQYAIDNGINTLDTAFSYGDSETILGKIINSNKDLKFSLISKFPKCSEINELKEYLLSSLDRLKTKYLYGYLSHDTDSVINNPGLWDYLSQAKDDKLLCKIGISVYYPSQIEWFLKKNIPFDIVQLPYNIFDNRFSYLFGELKQRGVEIHVRSVFLQGIVFKHPGSLPDHFNLLKDKLHKLNEISKINNVPLNTLLLCYVFLNLKIDKIVTGIDSLENLDENIKALSMAGKVERLMNNLSDLNIDDETILLPFNWIKK